MNKIETSTSVKVNKNEDVFHYKGDKYTYFDEGLTRSVWVNEEKTKVVKVLHDALNHDFNKDEFETYTNSSEKDRDQMALTELEDGVIVQEFCNPIKFDNRPLKLRQKLFAAQCRNEVGWNHAGELVCFDLDEYKKY